MSSALDIEQSIEENRTGTRTADGETGSEASSSSLTPAATSNSEIQEALKGLVRILTP